VNYMAGRVEEVTGTSIPGQNEMLSPEFDVQRHQLLIQWNDTASAFPDGRCIHELFAEQASQTPTAEAVALGDLRLTYAELDSRANQLAHYLRTIGVGPEVVVGLCLERSLELIVALMGILKAGGAYLPLDRNYPQERIAYLVKDACAPFVLTSEATDAVLSPYGLRTIKLDLKTPEITKQPTNAPESGVSSENLAYVIYTSGSSGNPKGVGVVHRNISRLVLNTNYVQISPQDVFLQLAPVTFDAATFEIWGALLNGAKLALYAPDPMLDLLKLKSVIQQAGVSVLWLTAGLFNSIEDGDASILSPVKQLLVGGDVVSATHVKRFMEQIPTCRVINGYGPTEGTTFSVCFPIPNISAIEKNVPIGRPVSNTTAYVLNSDGQPVPLGETGELYIGGAGLARGYFHRPDMAAESFVPNPFGERGSRLYRTGDLVRYSSDGVLEFVGRVDFQVKVRGYRIELEEVEAALLSDPGIRQAAVVVQSEPRGDKKLVAYVVGAGKAPDFRKVRERLGRRLPEYMVPSAMVILDALPLTANGKVDRKALLSSAKPAERTAAGPGVEEAITDIWSATLGTNNIGLDDDFFDLGGTSLALINVVVEMSKRFSIPLETGIVAGGATVRALSQAVKEKIAVAAQAPQVEQTITDIWYATLGTNKIGLDDDFFDLGGTSLALINVVVEMSKRFGIPLETGIVAGGATVRALSQAVKEKIAVAAQAPQVEQTITDIWSATLGTNKIGLDDDFFDLGGTSLALINVVVEMSKRFGIPLETGIVAGGATVRALTQAVKEQIAGRNQEQQLEQAITEIWAAGLGTDNIGLDDDFFDLGGTSLALIHVVVEMSKRFGIPLETGIVAGGATVRALVQAVKEKLAGAKQEPQIAQAITAIWASTLGTSNIGVDDDFFDLGGTSLALINVVMEMSKQFGMPLETSIVTGGATVRALAQAVSSF
jgi:amino acid adenylation domain-containing protein